MDGWMDGPGDCLASLCPSWTKGTQRRHRSNEEEEEDSIFPSFFLSSFSDCVRWRFERFEVGKRACCHISEMGISGSFRLSLARSTERRGAFNQRSIQTAKPEMEMELPRWREGGGGGARAVYRKWRVQMNGVRFGTTG